MARDNKPSKIGDLLKRITKKSVEDAAIQEKKKAYDIRKIFEQMELELISSMKKAFYFHQREQQKEGFVWEQWQLSKLRAIEEYRKRNKKLVDSYSKPIQKAIDNELKQSYLRGQNRFKKLGERLIARIKQLFELRDFKVDAKVGLPSDIAEKQKVRDYISSMLGKEPNPQPDKDFFGVNDKKLEALQKVVEQDLNKAQYSVLRKMDDVYRQTIYKTHVYLQSGVKSLNKAIDMATKEFLNKGIDSITYKDGKKVNIASYAEMCLRTASHRATLLGEGKKRDEWGIHLIIVSAHANTCPMCEPWQGKILIDDVFSHGTKEDGEYPLLSDAIKTGLLHPNCRHTLTTYFPSITQMPTVPDGEEAIKTYEAEQKQRALEREIRKWKRIAEGTLDPLAQGKAIDKVKQLQKDLNNQISKNPQLRRAEEREKNKVPVNNIGDNGLNNKNTYLNLPKETIEHANEGEFTKPRNPNKIKPGEIRLKSGGHGQSGIQLLNDKGIEYNIVKEYKNGVRIGNVPSHKMKVKQTGTGQAWFPKSWDANEIENAGKYVANLKVKSDYVIENKYSNDQVTAIFKFANYKGVTVGVCYDVKQGKITTIFPDETQRMLGGE
ncbi:MAG: phage minor capsid protein [Bacillota bacterium]|nr:phage minor capsid protein [Bacillota bacterium]